MLLVVGLSPSVFAGTAEPRAGVNAVLGDDSYLARFGAAPGAEVDEDLRIRVHLEYVEGLLRAADASGLSDAQRAARARNLDLLNAYHRRGVFPRNHEVPGRRPHFIDDEGRICAVGYLIEQTARRALAEAINAEHEWAYPPEIRGAEVEAWVRGSGLSVRELAMIQPGYGFMKPRPRPQPIDEGEQRLRTVPRQLAAAGAQVQDCADRIGLPARVGAVAVDVTLSRYAVRVEVGRGGSAAFRACVKRAAAARVGTSYFRRRTAPLTIRHTYGVAGGSRGMAVDREAIGELVRSRLMDLQRCLEPERARPAMHLRIRVTVDPSGRFVAARVLRPAAERPGARDRCVFGVLSGLTPPPFAGRITGLTFELGPRVREGLPVVPGGGFATPPR